MNRNPPTNGFDKRPQHINRAGPGLGGRNRVLRLFDQWLAEDGKGDKLRAAWETEFARDPLAFWRDYIVPLIPKEARIEVAEAMPRIRLTMVEHVGAVQPDTTS